MQKDFKMWITGSKRSSACAPIAPTFGRSKPRLWMTTVLDVFRSSENLRAVDRDFDNSKIRFLLKMMKDISLRLLESQGRYSIQSVDPARYDRYLPASLIYLKEALWLESESI